MDALIIFTADANAWAIDFRQTINIIQLNAQLLGNAIPHLLSPALRTNDTLAEIQLICHTTLLDFLCQQQSVRRCSTENTALHILHHLQLLVRITRAHRHSHSPQLLSTSLKADTGSPQAIASCNLDSILVGNSCHSIAAGKHGGPVIYILLGIRNNHWQACSTRGGMYSYHLFLWYCH